MLTNCTCGRSRDAVLGKLEHRRLGTGIYYPVPIYRQPPYRRLARGRTPERGETMFSIPFYAALAALEREHVAEE